MYPTLPTQVLYDAPIAEKTLAVHLSPNHELFYSTTDSKVCYWHEGLKFEHSLLEQEQAVALEYCVPDKGILALTNNHIFLVHGHRGLLFRLRIPVRWGLNAVDVYFGRSRCICRNLPHHRP